MELKPGMSALVTGGASGIGKALCIAFARRGLFVTVVDFSEENGREVATLVQKENSKFHGDLRIPSSIFVKCDVSNADNLAACFEKHVQTYNGLDICINCAGIANKTLVYDDTSDGTRTWRHAVNVNLVAVIDGTRIAFVQTNMAEQMSRKVIDSSGGYLEMEDVVNGTFELIQDESKAGACLWITKRRGMEYWPTPEEQRKYMVNPNKSKRMLTNNIYPSIRMPEFFEKIVVHTLSHNFRNATRLERVQLRFPIKAHSALVKIIYAGVNASDVNFSSGRYFSGNPKETASRLPFDAGFEGVGIVAAVGDSVSHIKVGTPVALMTFGSYAEFTEVPAKHLLPVPRPDPEVVAMLTSGLTASISLEKAGQMTSGQVVLVTAAAGGTGQFAVQVS
ncbi:ARP protein (REF) [Zea mays]|uniref:ARP protein (REF) n=1 Tax=Zea mays TaxID=4577 RepID=A0A1D6I5W0_MAIZE|nr:ARP protein (REF) [Zea mays]